MATKATHRVSMCMSIKDVLYPTGWIISIVFLSLSLFVYAIVRELRNLHGKCLMCHMASLLTTYVFLTINGNYVDVNFGIASGFIVYSSTLSSFTWLTIMCIDILIAISGVSSIAGNDQRKDRKKFVIYAACSLVPLIILNSTLIAEGKTVPDHFLELEFSEDYWVESLIAEAAYYILPVGLILSCNVVLIVLTARKINKFKKETNVLEQGDSRRQEGEDINQRFQRYRKLFIVMSVGWALGIISWIIREECFWIPTNLLSVLQGLFEFIIFVWKVDIHRELVKALCPRLAAKVKVMVPTSSVNSDQRILASIASSDVVNLSTDEGNFNVDSLSSKDFERNPSVEMTTVT